jgi:hypothetical protein
MQRMTADDLAAVKVRAAKGSNAAVPDIATDAACVSDRRRVQPVIATPR